MTIEQPYTKIGRELLDDDDVELLQKVNPSILNNIIHEKEKRRIRNILSQKRNKEVKRQQEDG